MTYFPCLASVTIIYCVVVGQRSPATPPSILLASDTLSSDSGQKPLPAVSSVLLVSWNKNSRFDGQCNMASLRREAGANGV